MKQLILKLILLALVPAFVSFTTFKESQSQEYINGSPVIWVEVVHLSGDNEVPPVNTDAKGIATLRVTQDMMLHSKVIVQKVDPVDDGMLTASHIHIGAAGVNGGVLLFLAHDPGEFGVNMVQQLTTAQYNAILNDALYVNVHSTVYPAGLIRGQIR